MSAPKLNAFQRMIRFTGLERGFGPLFICAILGWNIGAIVDRSDTESMVIFRDRSALYAGKKKESDPPSWPSKEIWWT